jgi:hypothetical protein
VTTNAVTAIQLLSFRCVAGKISNLGFLSKYRQRENRY